MPGRDPISQLGDLEALQTNADRIVDIVSTIKEAIKSVPEIALAYKNSQGGAELKKNTEDLVKANNDLLNSQKALTVETEKAKSLQGDLAKQIAIQRELNKQKATDMRTEAREAAGLTDAYKKLDIQQKEAARTAKNIGIEQGVTSEAYKKASTYANGLSETLKKLDADQGQHTRKVGDYVGAISILDKSLGEIKNKMDQLTKAGAGNSREYQQLSHEYELISSLTSQQAKGFTSLTMEIRANERALQTLRAAGMEDTDAFKELQLQVAGAKREFNEFQKSQQLLESAAPHLQALTTVAKGLGGIYATGAGAAALFADGNEKVEKELNKLVAIMTILQGLNEVHELLERKGAIATLFHFGAIKSKNTAMVESTNETVANEAATEGAAVAETEAAVATTAWGTALKFLKMALIATGLGALLVLLPEIANAFSMVADESEKMKLEQEALQEVNEKAVDTYAGELVQVQLYVKELQDEKISRQEKTQIIDDLQKKYPDYLSNIKNEGQYTADLADAINTKLIPAIKQEAIVKAAQDLITAKTKEVLETQLDMVGKGATLWDKFKMALGGATLNMGLATSGIVGASQNAADQIADLQKQIDALIKVALSGEEALSGFGKGSHGGDKIKQDFTDYEEGFKALREEIQKFQNEAFGKDLDPYLKSLADLLERYQETFIKINDVRDKDLQKVKENADKGIITEGQAAKLRVKIEEDSDQEKLAAETAYYANLNALQEKERQEMAAKRKAQDEKNFQEAIAQQQRIQKALQENASEHFRTQAQLAKNAQQISPTFGNDKALAAAERDEQIHNLTMLLQQKKITQEEFDSDMAVVQDTYSKRVSEAQIKQITSYADRAKTVFNDVAAIEKQAEERRIAALQHQIQLNDELKNKEISRIQESSLKEGQKAAAEAMLQKKTAEENAVLQRKIRDEKEKEARFDKAKGIMDAVVNTYVNASRVSYDPIQEALVIAAGIAAVAEISAQRIPQYAGGTEYAPRSTWALTDEKGAEGYITPRGEVFIGNDHPTMRFIEEGTRIIPHEQLRQHQSFQGTTRPQENNDLRREIRSLRDTIRETSRDQVSAIRKNKPIPPSTAQDPGPAFWAMIYKACS